MTDHVDLLFNRLVLSGSVHRHDVSPAGGARKSAIGLWDMSFHLGLGLLAVVAPGPLRWAPEMVIANSRSLV